MVVLGARARGLSHRLCPPGLPGKRMALRLYEKEI